MERIVLYNGRIVDPANGLDEENLSLLIEKGKIIDIAEKIKSKKSDVVIDCQGKIICPGLIDMHTHLRDPGEEEKEDIRTGSMAACAGGFTRVACMGNTNPINDTPKVTHYILQKAEKVGLVRIHPVGAITKGLKGKRLVNFGKMEEAGVVGFSDDGFWLADGQLASEALLETMYLGSIIISHCENLSLNPQNDEGVINRGQISKKLKFKGLPREAEINAIKQDITLAGALNCAIHIAHVSTAEGVNLIRQAKIDEVAVTADTCPQYVSLTEETVLQQGALAKVKPPLRTKKDVEAIKEGLADGTIDVIASDHAPHQKTRSPYRESSKETFRKYLAKAEFGMIGLQTTVPLVMTELVQTGILSLYEAIEKLTINPARILGIILGGTLSISAEADVTIINFEEKRMVEDTMFFSKSVNSPFIGMTLRGWPVITIKGGEIKYRDGKIIRKER